MTSTGSGLNVSVMDAVIDMPSSTTTVVGPSRRAGPTVLGFDQFYDAVSTAFVPVKVAAPSVTTFVGELATTPLGVMELACVSGSPVTATRTPRLIRAADSGYLKVSVETRGYGVLTQDGREAALTPGDLAVYDTTRPYELLFAHDFQQLVLVLPRQLLSIRPRDLTDLTARRIPGRTGMGAVLSPFLTLLARQSLAGDLQPSMEVCDAVVDLLSATCRSAADSAGTVPHLAQRALLLRLQAHIEERLGDPSLDATTVAAAHHISVRYLQKLFQAEETTVSTWIRRRRLDRCLRDLRDERLRKVPAAAIGARWGYTDPANFARAVRHEFGSPPSTFRPA
jgi:AraC-like DNA-binding protein